MIDEINTLADLPQAARRLLEFGGESRVFLFYGEMGAGKTTLIKVICQLLGVTESTASPTFALVNEYSAGGEPVYHFDLYRLQKAEEAYDMGYEEYLWSGHYCFVEWPEKAPGIWPSDTLSVHIQVNQDGGRVISAEKST